MPWSARWRSPPPGSCSASGGHGYLGYGLLVALLGWFHVYALLLLPAHAVTVVLRRRTEIVPWLAAVAGAGLLLVPLAVIAAGQRDEQLFWLKVPDLAALGDFGVEIAGSWTAWRATPPAGAVPWHADRPRPARNGVGGPGPVRVLAVNASTGCGDESRWGRADGAGPGCGRGGVAGTPSLGGAAGAECRCERAVGR